MVKYSIAHVVERATGEVIAEYDSRDICAGAGSSAPCGGCGACMLAQADIRADDPMHEVIYTEHEA